MTLPTDQELAEMQALHDHYESTDPDTAFTDAGMTDAECVLIAAGPRLIAAVKEMRADLYALKHVYKSHEARAEKAEAERDVLDKMINDAVVALLDSVGAVFESPAEGVRRLTAKLKAAEQQRDEWQRSTAEATRKMLESQEHFRIHASDATSERLVADREHALRVEAEEERDQAFKERDEAATLRAEVERLRKVEAAAKAYRSHFGHEAFRSYVRSEGLNVLDDILVGRGPGET